MANNISKRVGSSIRADEIGWDGLKKNPKADADAALLDLGLGGGVSKPIPVFTDETTSWTIYNVTSTDDDDKPGIYCLAVFDMPHDSMGLKLKYCYVKQDGTYGRVKWFPSYRLDDDERSAGRVEVQFGPLRPNSRIDIVRAVAVKRAAKDVGNPDLAEEDRRGKGTTPAYAPESLPLTGGINAYWGAYAAPFANRIRFTSGPNALATILTGDYIISSPRILAVGSPKKEVDGVYYPVTFGTTNGAELLMASLRLGIYRVGTKAGGINTYSKRIPVPRYDLTEEDRTTLDSASQLTIDVGPLKANKRYHIKWARGRYSLDPDDSGAKTIRVRHPLESIVAGVDINLDYLPDGIVRPANFDYDINDNLLGDIPGNDGAGYPVTGDGPQLGVLAPTGDIIYAPSDPDASDIIINEPDLATEKDKDARIVLRVWAADSDHAKTFDDANVNRVAVVIRNITADGTTKQRRHAVDVEDPTATSVNIEFHRQIGRPLQWVKNVSLNEADREFSTGAVLDFTAGAMGTGSEIDATFVLDVTGDGDDNKQADATISWTNGTTPAVPKRVVILRAKSAGTPTLPSTTAEKLNGNSNWKVVFKKNLKAESNELVVASTAVSQKYTIPGVTARVGTRTYLAYLWVVGNADPVADDTDTDPGGAEDALLDTIVPGTCGAVKIKFKHGNLRCKTLRPSPAGDGNRNITSYVWVVNDNSSPTASSRYLNEAGTDPEITEVTSGTPTTFVTSGTTLNLPVKKHLMSAWTTIYCHVIAVNNIGNGTPVATGSVAYSSLVSGVYNDDENVPLRRTFHGRKNLIKGGSCKLSTNQLGGGTGVDKMGKNVYYLPSSGSTIAIDANRVDINLAAQPFYWLKANGCLAHGTKSTPAGFVDAVAWQIGRNYETKEILTLTWRARAAGANVTPSWRVWIASEARAVLSGTDNGVTANVKNTVSGEISTTWDTFVTELFLEETVPANFIYLIFEETAGAMNYYTNNFCLVRGRQGQLWEPTDEEDGKRPESTGGSPFTGGLPGLVADAGSGLGQDGLAIYTSANGGKITL